MPRFTKMNPSAFKRMTWDSGIIVNDFNPTTGEIDLDDIQWETTGDISFSSTRDLTDMGAEINNCPENTMQLQKAQPWQAQITGTAVTITGDTIAAFLGNADANSPESGPVKVTPRSDLLLTDFADKWLIVNYSDLTGETNGGYAAIHLMNALSTEGFSATFGKNKGGQFPFTLKSFYDMEDMSKVPFEIYVLSGSSESSEEKSAQSMSVQKTTTTRKAGSDETV